MDNKIHQEWHHICLTLNTNYVNSDTVHVTLKMYYDGSELTNSNELTFSYIHTYTMNIFKKIFMLCSLCMHEPLILNVFFRDPMFSKRL